ncbi:hypothetical protein [Acinetobacter stercoris]|uniref:Uncharacterized protein n=1 Tax=Acinetobacter stercoris TaxID=2126983 RepID=A0A2U3MV69_9GAMM|nr:hypothetical protein [Acinetobacter stercoris]SPL69265.1 hypothetical protein KPC_0443 [Acinetobacter stercoris]
MQNNMMNNYWQFILGLQHNAQRFFDNEIAYYQIQHEWCAITNQLFMVRDFETNELIYDSIDHFIVDMNEQCIQRCRLVPFQLIYPNFTTHFKQYIFDMSNYPLAVFLGRTQSFALVKIEREKVKEFINSSDPREFSGFTSSQIFNEYLLFTLIRLDPKQLQTINEFTKHQNWKTHHEYFKTEFLDNKFNFTQNQNLKLINNLFLEDEATLYPFLQENKSQPNLAFSWVKQLEDLQNQIETEKELSRDSRSSHSDFIDQNFSQICIYQENLNYAFINLLSHTANDYKNAYIDQDFKLVPYSSTNIPDTATEPDNNTVSCEYTNEKPITTLASTIYLLIFIAIGFGILYGLFWLMSHFEFARFTVITIVVVSFLYIWSKK